MEEIPLNTVVILGAGSSKVYDFCTGPELLHVVSTKLGEYNDRNRHNQLIEAFKSNINPDLKNHFPFRISQDSTELHEILNESKFLLNMYRSIDSLKSIDNWIGHAEVAKKKWAQKILKMIVYTEIEEKEVAYKTQRQFSNNWMQYFFKHYCTNLKDTNYSFINFNYDRIFDSYLKKQFLVHSLSGPDFELALTAGELDTYKSDEFEKIKLIHPYGQLGTLAEKPIGRRANAYTDYIKLIDNITVIDYERGKQKERFDDSIQLLKSAQRIVFLGFGFDHTNLLRLGFFDTDISYTKDIFFSSFKLTPIERQKLIIDKLKIPQTPPLESGYISKSHGDMELSDFMSNTGCFL